MLMADGLNVDQLKAEGNALFVKHEYSAAIKKYTAALELDDKNAILYANRAACYLGLQEYFQAAEDGRKATVIDPNYPKAWARLASAHVGLNDHSHAAEVWAKALASLPERNLNAAEQKQKQQYEAELKTAQSRMQYASNHGPARHVVIKAGTEMPWKRANDMHAELQRAGPAMYASSAWVIWGAAQDWDNGMGMLRALKAIRTPQGTQFLANTLGLGELTNAILRDTRIFHITDSNFMEMYNNQMAFECTKARAWVNDSSSTVIREALPRQRNEGWDSVRPAVAVTVRAWIMRAFVADRVHKNVEESLKLYGWVLDILQWGRQVWKDVPKDNKGAVFEDTFLNGVRGLRIEALMDACAENISPDSKYPLSDLYEEAQDMLLTLDATKKPTYEVDPGFISSFFIYPRGLAYAMIAFYHKSTAMQLIADDEDPPEVIEHMIKAASAYIQAADIYPEDDEQHAWYLHCGLDCFYKSLRPVSELLQVHKRIRLAIPKMKRIWENSTMAVEGRDSMLASDVANEDDLLKGLAEGTLTLDSVGLATRRRA